MITPKIEQLTHDMQQAIRSRDEAHERYQDARALQESLYNLYRRQDRQVHELEAAVVQAIKEGAHPENQPQDTVVDMSTRRQ